MTFASAPGSCNSFLNIEREATVFKYTRLIKNATPPPFDWRGCWSNQILLIERRPSERLPALPVALPAQELTKPGRIWFERELGDRSLAL